jgi:ABC-type sugar transport system ATPase subunit
LFRWISRLTAEGRGVVFVSHKMEEIYRIADRITVLEGGTVVGTAPRGDLGREELLRWMAGGGGPVELVREATAEQRPEPTRPATPAPGRIRDTPLLPHYDVAGLDVPSHSARHLDVADVSFQIARGEIVGLAGLRGSGTTALLEALFGARQATGRVALDGRPVRLVDPATSIQQGIVFLSDDRRGRGLFLDGTVTENTTLACLSRFSQSGFIRRDDERRAVERLAARTRLVVPSLDAPVRMLSGGNQQKVYLARCLLASPKVLLLDEPTRGVDVGAKSDIHDLLREVADGGAALLVFSTELEELLSLCDRVLVMHKGKMTADLSRARATREGILAAAMGARGVA